ncbi:DUF2513 domain-containing protein [Alcaligenes faecalis]|uniref:DUF2513 domain-containing protein n=1 Tax=Alcaligenes faecalis TaxID=511 RepID=A0ABY7N7A9_ALCFA|nr:DUF2513 domain-containing protein [Alcaligenes faecalis]WBM40018.1 DUF2513 domain-containing protein [Alcaligenes faecalis]
MNRDMDLIRRIALAAADAPIGASVSKLEGVKPEVFSLHVIWMHEAGLVKAVITELMNRTTTAVVLRLTWEGCEFVDSVRSDTVWKKAKENVIKPGMSFTFGVLKEWVKTEITQGLPSLRAGG